MNIGWWPMPPTGHYQSNIIMRNYSSLSTPANTSIPWSRPNQNLIRPQRETESTRQLSCDVVFGSPSADCMGTGVCRISARLPGMAHTSELKRSCRSAMGLLFPIEGGKGVSLILTRAMLCTQLYKTQLRHDSLILVDPCPLPKNVVKPLGLKFTELPAGKYLIQQAEGFLRIDFRWPTSCESLTN